MHVVFVAFILKFQSVISAEKTSTFQLKIYFRFHKGLELPKFLLPIF